MPQPYRIIDLTGFPGVPTGSEIMEVSLAGSLSAQIPIGQLLSRVPNVIIAGGTVLISGLSNAYGDILITTSSAVTVQLPLAASRLGVPVPVIAVQITTPNITILPFAGETILGLSSFTITNPYGGITLWPAAGTGWYQK